MNVKEDQYLAHYGMPRRSGRYPWGSGEEPRSQSVGSKKSQHNSRYEMLVEESFVTRTNTNKRFISRSTNSIDERQSGYVKIGTEWTSAAKAAKTGQLRKTQNSFTLADLKMINPDFGEHGTMNNCMKCTTAIELRRRGYDVCAGKSIGSKARIEKKGI